MEVWIEFIDGYEVSNHGRIRNKHSLYIWKPQKRRKNAEYLSVNVRTVNYDIHKLVALYFLEAEEGLEVRHLDSNPLNNHYTNLAWGTHKQNIQDALDRNSHTSQNSKGFINQKNESNKPSKVKKVRNLPIGVSERVGARGVKYIAKMSNQACGQVYLGSFDSIEDAYLKVKKWYFDQYGVDL